MNEPNTLRMPPRETRIDVTKHYRAGIAGGIAYGAPGSPAREAYKLGQQNGKRSAKRRCIAVLWDDVLKGFALETER